eukprot:4261796-Pyramimonas_sp.AAC.1
MLNRWGRRWLHMAASAAGLNTGVPAVIGVAGCPARPSAPFARRSRLRRWRANCIQRLACCCAS